MSRRQHAGWADLLGAILRDTPPLPGAACRGRHRLFDADDEQTEAAAAARELCHNCPALAACRAWAATGPRVSGVLAGRIHH